VPANIGISSQDTLKSNIIFKATELEEMKKNAKNTAKFFFSQDARRCDYVTNLLILTYKLMCFLRNHDTQMKPYIQSLPIQELPTMANWKKQVLCDINSKTLIETIQNIYKSVNSLYNGMFYPSNKSKDTNAKPIVLRDEFYFAINLAASRYTILNDQNFKNGLCVCPFVDLINHSFNPNCEICYENTTDSNPSFLVKSLRKIDIGEQLFINYGDLSNYNFAQKYGFAIENNPYSNIPLQIEYTRFFNILKDGVETKTELLRKCLKTPSDEDNFVLLYKNKIDENLLPKLRIWFMTPYEVLMVHREKNFDFHKRISKENEKRVMEFLIETLTNKLSSVSKTNFTKMKNTLKPFKTIHDYNLYTATLLEEEESQIIHYNLDNLFKK